MHAGELTLHGLFDIARREDGSTFVNYTYPSRLPAEARKRMTEVAADLVAHTGYDDAVLDIEFFYDADTGRTWILEVNPRISQEHADLMAWVDGMTNLEVMAQAALGDEPGLERGEGSCGAAGKFFHRHDHDAMVARVPSAEEIAALEEAHAPAIIDVGVHEGDRLSELPDQEPYSYRLADVYLGAEDHDHLHRRYDAISRELTFELREPGD